MSRIPKVLAVKYFVVLFDVVKLMTKFLYVRTIIEKALAGNALAMNMKNYKIGKDEKKMKNSIDSMNSMLSVCIKRSMLWIKRSKK